MRTVDRETIDTIPENYTQADTPINGHRFRRQLMVSGYRLVSQ